jgi:hypothetical protein
MYTAIILLVAGAAIALGSDWMLVLVVPAASGAIWHQQVFFCREFLPSRGGEVGSAERGPRWHQTGPALAREILCLGSRGAVLDVRVRCAGENWVTFRAP